MFRIISSKQQTWILCCELDLLLHLSLLTAALINRGGSHPRLTRKIKAQLFYLTNTRPAPTQSFSERPDQFLCVRRLWLGIFPSSCITHWELWRSDARRTALWCSLQGLLYVRVWLGSLVSYGHHVSPARVYKHLLLI